MNTLLKNITLFINTYRASEEKNESQRHPNWHFITKFHDFSMIHHFSNSMTFPCMEFILAIFHVFQVFQCQWEPCFKVILETLWAAQNLRNRQFQFKTFRPYSIIRRQVHSRSVAIFHVSLAVVQDGSPSRLPRRLQKAKSRETITNRTASSNYAVILLFCRCLKMASEMITVFQCHLVYDKLLSQGVGGANYDTLLIKQSLHAFTHCSTGFASLPFFFLKNQFSSILSLLKVSLARQNSAITVFLPLPTSNYIKQNTENVTLLLLRKKII